MCCSRVPLMSYVLKVLSAYLKRSATGRILYWFVILPDVVCSNDPCYFRRRRHSRLFGKSRDVQTEYYGT